MQQLPIRRKYADRERKSLASQPKTETVPAAKHNVNNMELGAPAEASSSDIGHGSPAASPAGHEFSRISVLQPVFEGSMEARQKAIEEGVTAISPETQHELNLERSRGSVLDPESQIELGSAFDADFSTVRIHSDDRSNQLSQSLGARAFTQGSDVFLGPDVDLESDRGRHTLVHELTHVAGGQTAGGGVQLEGDAAVAPPQTTETRYTLTLSTGTLQNLTKEAALQQLNAAYQPLSHAIEMTSGEHAALFSVRTTGFFNVIGSIITDLAGESFPSLEIWNEPKAKMVGARMNLDAGRVEEAANSLKEVNAGYEEAAKKFQQYKDQLDSAAVKGQIGIAVVAVVVIAVAAVAVVAAPAAAAGGGAAAGTDAAATGVAADAAATTTATAGADATATTATTTLPGAMSPTIPAATIPDAALGAAVAPTAADAAFASTVVADAAGGAGIAADAAVQTTVTAMQTGGPAAATAVASGMSVEALEGAMAWITRILVINLPLSQREVMILDEVMDILTEVWKTKAGLPGVPSP